MSKTIEVWEEGDGYRVVSPDHEEEFVVNGYTVDADETLTVEDGRATVNIGHDEYFHVEETFEGRHVEISVSDEEPGPQEYVFPYMDDLTFEGKVERAGVPDTPQAQDALEQLPLIELVMEYQKGEATPVAVRVGAERYELQ